MKMKPLLEVAEEIMQDINEAKKMTNEEKRVTYIDTRSMYNEHGCPLLPAWDSWDEGKEIIRGNLYRIMQAGDELNDTVGLRFETFSLKGIGELWKDCQTSRINKAFHDHLDGMSEEKKQLDREDKQRVGICVYMKVTSKYKFNKLDDNKWEILDYD